VFLYHTIIYENTTDNSSPPARDTETPLDIFLIENINFRNINENDIIILLKNESKNYVKYNNKYQINDKYYYKYGDHSGHSRANVNEIIKIKIGEYIKETGLKSYEYEDSKLINDPGVIYFSYKPITALIEEPAEAQLEEPRIENPAEARLEEPQIEESAKASHCPAGSEDRPKVIQGLCPVARPAKEENSYMIKIAVQKDEVYLFDANVRRENNKYGDTDEWIAHYIATKKSYDDEKEFDVQYECCYFGDVIESKYFIETEINI